MMSRLRSFIIFVHPAEFLVTGPDGAIVDRTILGDVLLIPPEQISTETDQNRVFFLIFRSGNKRAATHSHRKDRGVSSD